MMKAQKRVSQDKQGMQLETKSQRSGDGRNETGRETFLLQTVPVDFTVKGHHSIPLFVSLRGKQS